MFLEKLQGTAPLLITVPHDGGVHVFGRPIRSRSAARDIGTLPLALRCYDRLLDLGIRPTLIWTTLHRSHADMNRGPESAEPFAEGFKDVHDGFHASVDQSVATMLALHGTAVHLDVHGTKLPEGIDCVLGTNAHATSLRGMDKVFASALRQNYTVEFSPGGRHNFEGRFAGGWIVRRSAAVWGAQGLDAIQIEIARHLREPEFTDELAGNIAAALALAI